MMQALEIVAGSWPIAAMVVAGTAGFVVWRLVSRAMKDSRDLTMERLSGSQAVVVQRRGSDED